MDHPDEPKAGFIFAHEMRVSHVLLNIGLRKTLGAMDSNASRRTRRHNHRIGAPCLMRNSVQQHPQAALWPLLRPTSMQTTMHLCASEGQGVFQSLRPLHGIPGAVAESYRTAERKVAMLQGMSITLSNNRRCASKRRFLAGNFGLLAANVDATRGFGEG
jgi:hypothetical protein